MKVRLVCAIQALARSVTEVLEAAGHEVELRHETAYACELRYTPDVPSSELHAITETLLPLAPVTGPVPLSDADVELHLGDQKALSSWDVKIHTDSSPLADRLRQKYVEVGFSFDGHDEESSDNNRMTYGGASGFARQVVRWFLQHEGIRVSEDKSWGDDDNDMWLYLQDPLFDGRDLRPHVAVHISGDDYEQMDLLKTALTAAGFEKVSFGADPDATRKFGLELGPYAKQSANAAMLRSAVADFLSTHDIDDERYPLTIKEEGGATARITLPLRAFHEDSLPPYAGAFADRWDVVVKSDDRSKVRDMVEAFEEAGYRVRYEPLEGAAMSFQARWGAASGHFSVVEFVTERLHEVREALEADEVFRVSTSRAFEEDDVKIELTIPTAGLSREGFEHHLRHASSQYDFTLRAPDPEAYSALTDRLSGYGFRAFNRTADSDYSSHTIKYGGAPAQLVEHLADVFEDVCGVRPAIEKAWGDSDHDIWVCVPAPTVALVARGPAPTQASFAQWFSEDENEDAEQPFVEVGDDHVRVGHIRLPRGTTPHDLVPRAEMFDHYCIDQRTAETLLHVAESVVLREPCLLEGETSVSKTSVVQFLGHLARRPVVRLNLNGQTDTGELVGRYVPQSSATLPVEPDALLAAVELLEDESRFILERARDEGRTLTEVEIQQIVANERMTVRPWRWQDGLVVAAMQHGWWLVLDELNLAEPQILERLNSVLERHPTLVLTEHDNRLFGPGGHPVHPEFRVFATMNPAEYAGRSALSPAYRDRWRGYRYVDPPTESEYRAMLQFGVFGTEPEVRVLGQAYLGRELEPFYGALADVPDIEHFLAALARFHAALEGAVGRTGDTARLGGRRRERYVFTRRGLLSVMDYLVSAVASEDPVRSMRVALYRYYLGRVAHAADRAVVVELLDAAGIGPNTWSLGSSAPDEDDLELDEEQQNTLRMVALGLPEGIHSMSASALASLSEQIGATTAAIRAFFAEEEE